MLLNVVSSVVFLDKVKMIKLASLAAAFRLRGLYQIYIYKWAIRKAESHGAMAEEIQSSEVHFKLHCQETETRLYMYKL